jgi:hypothetical protein
LRFFPWLFLSSFDFQQSQSVKMQLIPGIQPKKNQVVSRVFPPSKRFFVTLFRPFFVTKKSPNTSCPFPPLLPSDLDLQIRGLLNSGPDGVIWRQLFGCPSAQQRFLRGHSSRLTVRPSPTSMLS